MRKLVVFNNLSLDGYFASSDGDISWAKAHMDPEFRAFTVENAAGGGVLVFGRKTYELMTKYWPTPLAMQNDPAVAEPMNRLPKVVFSRTLATAAWNNTKLVKGDLATEVRKMKQEHGNDLVILGSGSIVSQLAQQGLIDQYQIVLNPVVLGAGRSMFDGLKASVDLKLTTARRFGNGTIFLCYEPGVQSAQTGQGNPERKAS
jgi:dihydrofolate reductase